MELGARSSVKVVAELVSVGKVLCSTAPSCAAVEEVEKVIHRLGLGS